jgi:hypothetical protein
MRPDGDVTVMVSVETYDKCIPSPNVSTRVLYSFIKLNSNGSNGTVVSQIIKNHNAEYADWVERQRRPSIRTYSNYPTNTVFISRKIVFLNIRILLDESTQIDGIAVLDKPSDGLSHVHPLILDSSHDPSPACASETGQYMNLLI